MPDISPGQTIRELRCPITAEQLTALNPECKRVQIAHSSSPSNPNKPTDLDFHAVSEFLLDYPDVVFRVYGLHTINNLEFLRFFRRHRRFQFDVFALKDIEGLRFLPEDLQELDLGATKSKLDVSFLQRFANLKSLYLDGHHKGIEAIGV
jgi:hypothetical protein